MEFQAVDPRSPTLFPLLKTPRILLTESPKVPELVFLSTSEYSVHKSLFSFTFKSAGKKKSKKRKRKTLCYIEIPKSSKYSS